MKNCRRIWKGCNPFRVSIPLSIKPKGSPVKYFIVAFLILVVFSNTTYSQSPKTGKEKLSYAVGANTAKNWQRESADIDLNAYIKGLKDALDGKTLPMTDQEITDSVKAYNQENMDRAMAKMKKLAEKNKNDGEAWLEANKKRPGVIVLSDGLQYKVVKEGTGKKPTLEDTVTVNYRGMLINGTVFDETYKRGTPATFSPTQLIPGLSEGLQLMKVGSKYEIYIPSNLAYGAHGKGAIEPNAVLVFDVELLSFK